MEQWSGTESREEGAVGSGAVGSGAVAGSCGNGTARGGGEKGRREMLDVLLALQPRDTSAPILSGP